MDRITLAKQIGTIDPTTEYRSRSHRKFYIAKICQFGCICYRELFSHDKYYDFAFRIFLNTSLFECFNREDQHYIETVAKLELAETFQYADYQTMLQVVRNEH